MGDRVFGERKKEREKRGEREKERKEARDRTRFYFLYFHSSFVYVISRALLFYAWRERERDWEREIVL